MNAIVTTSVSPTWKRLDQKDKSTLFHAAQSSDRMVPKGSIRDTAGPLMLADNTLHEETASAVVSLALREMGLRS